MRRVALGTVICALAVLGCGGRDYAPPKAAVVLSLDGPDDGATVDTETVDVRGRVQPAGARVTVAGEAVPVNDGAFSTSVALDAGTNVIDVLAAAPEHPAAVGALRVTRQVRVPVPFVEGQTQDEAAEEVSGLGFRVEVDDLSDLLDELLADEPGVCFTDPDAGTELLPGETVTLSVSPSCLDD